MFSAQVLFLVAGILFVIGITVMVLGARDKPRFVSWQRIAIGISLAIPVLGPPFYFISSAVGLRLYRVPFVLLAIPPVLSLVLVFGLLLGSREGQRKWFSGYLLAVGPLALLALLFARILSYPD